MTYAGPLLAACERGKSTLAGLGLNPGFIAERHFFFAIEVTPGERREPSLDGSALEAFGVVHALPLDAAIACCRDGRIIDEKTEIGLRRLKELLS